MNFFIYLLLWALSFAVDFSILFFFGTKDTGLCASIAFLVSSLTIGLIRQPQEHLKSLIPIFSQLDDHINSSSDTAREHDERLAELVSKIEDLENQVADLNTRIDELEHPPQINI
jgi:hypothetical protein